MRSKIGTQSRLAAHIAALFLLILMLVYLAPPVVAPVVEPVVEPAAVAAAMPVEAAAEPAAPVEPVAAVAALEPVVEPAAAPVAEAAPVVEPAAEPVAAAEPVVEPAVEPVAEPAAEPIEEPVETPVVADAPVEAAEELPAQPLPQPDESGSLVVAPADAGASESVVAPLTNANLEVLGDGFYWLSPRHDLETELAAVPEIANLIVLAPLPGHEVAGFEHVKTDVIPADPADLTRDAADRFVSLATKRPGPVVAAALPGARGAAFFKAAYLLRVRHLTRDETIGEIGADLEEAGTARDEVLHRLIRLAGDEPGESDGSDRSDSAGAAD